MVLISSIIKLYHPHALEVIAWSLASGAVFFLFSLVFYFIKILAPGDVKLLGVVGYWLGWGHFGDVLFWISFSTVVVGCLYLIIYCSKQDIPLKSLVLNYSSLFSLGKANSSSISIGTDLVMPFAPVVVIGLALNSYF
jgi:prepilin peptidase CpaA